jgi:predicted SAM-dependent methyltransferase
MKLFLEMIRRSGDGMATLKQRLGAVLIPALPINRRTFDILRHELRSFTLRARNLASVRYYSEIRRLRRSKDLSVNLGSGGKGLEGWVNIELVRARDTSFCFDIRRTLPLADQSVSRILAEHVVEHIDHRQDIPKVFADWFRVLRKGGIVRIVVPDVPKFMDAYLTNDFDKWMALGFDLNNMPSDMSTQMQLVNHVFHQSGEHLFGYDFETMKWALRNAGFSTIERMSYRVSKDPLLTIDQENNAPYSLYVEATK